MKVVAVGADVFERGLADVVRDVPRLEPREVGQLILAASRARAPVDTGKLRASGRAQGMSVKYEAPYAGPIHWGWRKRNIEANPWLTRSTESTVEAWTGAFADALQEEIDRTL